MSEEEEVYKEFLSFLQSQHCDVDPATLASEPEVREFVHKVCPMLATAAVDAVVQAWLSRVPPKPAPDAFRSRMLASIIAVTTSSVVPQSPQSPPPDTQSPGIEACVAALPVPRGAAIIRELLETCRLAAAASAMAAATSHSVPASPTHHSRSSSSHHHTHRTPVHVSQPPLTVSELSVLRFYTYNDAVRSGLDSFLLARAANSGSGGDVSNGQHWMNFLRLLLAALRALPAHSGTVYRGVRESVDINGAYAKGKRVCWPTLSSASLSQDAARKAVSDSSTGWTGSFFTIKTKTARALPDSPDMEALLEPNSEFIVVSSQDLGYIVKVELQQTETTSPFFPQTPTASPDSSPRIPRLVLPGGGGGAGSPRDYYRPRRLSHEVVVPTPPLYTLSARKASRSFSYRSGTPRTPTLQQQQKQWWSPVVPAGARPIVLRPSARPRRFLLPLAKFPSWASASRITPVASSSSMRRLKSARKPRSSSQSSSHRRRTSVAAPSGDPPLSSPLSSPPESPSSRLLPSSTLDPSSAQSSPWVRSRAGSHSESTSPSSSQGFLASASVSVSSVSFLSKSRRSFNS